jgi:hypothetical protein
MEFDRAKQNVRDRLAQSLAKSSYQQSQRSREAPQSLSATVLGFEHGLVKVSVNGGDIRYCQSIGVQGLAVGDNVNAVFPIHSLYGQIDTKVGK